MKAAASLRSSAHTGKQSFLPPKCPFPVVAPACGDYGSIGSKAIPRQRDGQKHHQRTSSESIVIEEQPSWLDDLLNEPETPVKKGTHRRSSSDSLTYLDGTNFYSNNENIAQEDCRNGSIGAPSPWCFQDFDQLNEKLGSYYAEANTFGRPQSRRLEPVLNTANHSISSSFPQSKDNILNRGTPSSLADPVAKVSEIVENKEHQVPAQELKGTLEKKDDSHSKQSEVDQKRVKQQFAQRSRVRKLQYIAELERTVQAMQAEGLEVSAELEFLDQQNVILNMENKTLKQQLNSLAQEQLIKRLQQEMLERERARLRMLYQQQQQQQQQLHQQQAPSHARRSSKDLDSQFASLSLKHKLHSDTNSGCDPFTTPLHI